MLISCTTSIAIVASFAGEERTRVMIRRSRARNIQLEHELRIDQRYTSVPGAIRMIEKLGEPTRIEATMVTMYDGNIRRVEDLISGSVTHEVKTMESEIVGSYYRFVSSKEEAVPSTLGEETGITYRLRYVYNGWAPQPPILGVDGLDLHITFRTNVADRITQAVSIEVEAKVGYNAEMVDSIANRVMNLHYGMNVPDLARTITSMRNSVTSMGLRAPQQLQRPYDLTWRNFTYNELVENRTAISYKADGVRMLLCLSNDGAFYVTSNLDIVPITLGPVEGRPITLIDGELMGNTYHAFDLLHLDGVDYMGSNYDTRHEVMTQLIEEMGPIIDGLNIVAKPIIIPTDEESFYDAVTQMLDVEIETDGLIITPVEQGYSAPVFKWKPQRLMTVDFFIGRNHRLYTFDDGRLRPHDELTLSHVGGAKIGTVAELRYDGDGRWAYVRDRLDKATPNAERVYQAIMRLIMDPIDRDSMLGLSLKPMRKYHNRVKTAIYELLANEGVTTITDVGAGRGGDLSKYRDGRFSIIAIEPDITNIEGRGGFIERASTMDTIIDRHNGEWDIVGDGWSVNLFNVKAQDYMPEQETDALTLFNVATFLGPTTMDHLTSNAIRDDGYLVIMAIDGRRLQSRFLDGRSQYDSDLIYMARSPCGSIGETFGSMGCIRIQLKDSSTVTRPQVEGLVDTDLMIKNLRNDGWMVLVDTYLDGEQLLGREGSAYSACQRVTVLKRIRIGDTIVRQIYRPLPVGQQEQIDTPYGPLIRVGVMSGIGHAILQATDPDYRSASNVGKSIYVSSLPNDWEPDVTVYLIPEDGWARHYHTNGSGITLFRNMGHWEPLARRNLDGSLNYMWA